MIEPADAEPAVLRLSGDVDIASENQWSTAIDEFLEAHPRATDLVVDAGQVTFLDSRGMAVLVRLHTRALERGGSVTLNSVPPRIAKALSVAGLDKVFAIV